MTFAVFDFQNIHARMRGDHKQQPECVRCEGKGWTYTHSDLGLMEVCPLCFNPEGHPFEPASQDQR
jgi:hypothetical protein